jgi:ArsR family transcriptional regulator, arsenate/arsenite/antimonite-responsive transcriptional repressor / arsenate reductase (thioredoxin)
MKRRVLFLCTANAARSQMAEALLKNQANDHFEVFSAGIAPLPVDPQALDAMNRFGLATVGLTSKAISVFKGQHFDFVITLCGKAQQECKNFPGANEFISWDFEDPKIRQVQKPYDTTLRELNERIKMFVLVQTKKGKVSL